MNPTPPSKRRRSASPPNRPSLSPSRPVLPPPTPSAHAPPGSYQLYHPSDPIASSSSSAIAGPSNWQIWSTRDREREVRDVRDREREMVDRDRMRDRDISRQREREYEMERSRERDRDRAGRRSMDARSPMSEMESPRMEGIDEGSEASMIFTRDANKAPRSMMACTRCRKQKMKCDGPGQIPCRGCKASGQTCVFEARSRPKSISAIPSRTTAYLSGPSGLGRPISPITGPSGQTAFHPAQSQLAPPITSRHPPPPHPYHQQPPPPPSDPFGSRTPREPMPPAAGQSLMGAMTSQYRGHSPSASTSAIPTGPQPYYSQQLQPPPPPGPPPQTAHQPPQIQIPPYARPLSPESRLRNVENSLRPLLGLPHSISALQSSITHLQRTTDSGFSLVSRPVRSREIIANISDELWASYRQNAWPLTPWLVGLRESVGLAGLVVTFLAKRTLLDRGGLTRRECEEAKMAVCGEIGRLIGDGIDWTREEIRALGVFATWTNDCALASLAVGQSRMQGLDRVLSPRRTHDDWREWIYLSLMDKLCHVVDFTSPVSSDQLSSAWRDRVAASPSSDPAVRDRDTKLGAWLEYAESLVEIHVSQTASSSTPLIPSSPAVPIVAPGSSGVGEDDGRSEREGRPGSGSVRGDNASVSGDQERKRAMDIWKKWGPRWEAWATVSIARSDPILSLHLSYATLFSSSPVFLASQSVWMDLSSNHDGYQQLERCRDAAFAVIQAVCMPEVSRTLPFSFALFRPLLGLSLQTLISIHLSLPNSPIISPSHLTSVLRSTFDTISSAHPLDVSPIPPPSAAGIGLGTRASVDRVIRPSSRTSRLSFSTQEVPPILGVGSIGVEGSLLKDMVDSGLGRGREVWGVEPGRDLWRRLIG